MVASSIGLLVQPITVYSWWRHVIVIITLDFVTIRSTPAYSNHVALYYRLPVTVITSKDSK